MVNGKLPATASQSSFSIGVSMDLPTFEVASVKLFNVVDLPDEGLPTKPMRGSRGMIDHLIIFKAA